MQLSANQQRIADLNRGIDQMRKIRLVAAGAGNKAEAESYRRREARLRKQVRTLGGKA